MTEAPATTRLDRRPTSEPTAGSFRGSVADQWLRYLAGRLGGVVAIAIVLLT